MYFTEANQPEVFTSAEDLMRKANPPASYERTPEPDPRPFVEAARKVLAAVENKEMTIPEGLEELEGLIEMEWNKK